jgi:hypothetical protein
MKSRFAAATMMVLTSYVSAHGQWTPPNPQGHINNTNTGSVGIGTSAPTAKLTVSDPVNGAILHLIGRTSDDTASIQFRTGAGSTYAYITPDTYELRLFHSDGNVTFFPGGTEKVRITNAGNVGIGTSTPNNRLYVKVTGSTDGITIDGTANPAITMKNDGTAKAYVGLATQVNAFITNASPNDLILRTEDATNGKIMFVTQGGIHAAATITRVGDVGVGTSSPTAKLHLMNSAGPTTLLIDSTGTNNPSLNLSQDQFTWASFSRDNTNGSIYLRTLQANKPLYLQTTSAGNVLIPTGNVGIGTTAPDKRLVVAGDAHVTGTLTGGVIHARYQDIAEWVPSTESLEPGVVVVLDEQRENHVRPSGEAYDTRVAGVVSAQPGIALGEEGPSRELIATTGRVRTRVVATRPIRIGDLLVTSHVRGAAMPSEAFSVGGRTIHQPGTIIGKALEPLASGEGVILVLLSLQ